jgi:hypothetical protein
MCIDSPDGPVLSILSQLQEEFVSVVYSYLVYYVQGCPAAQAPVELDQRIQILDKYVFPALQGLGSAILLDSNSSSISSGGEVLQDNWEAICGTSFSPFLAILGALDNQLCILTQTLVSACVRASALCVFVWLFVSDNSIISLDLEFYIRYYNRWMCASCSLATIGTQSTKRHFTMPCAIMLPVDLVGQRTYCIIWNQRITECGGCQLVSPFSFFGVCVSII